MSYDLKNSVLVQAKINDIYADVTLPREFVTQIKSEMKIPSLHLKDIHLESPDPKEPLQILTPNLSFNLFIVLRMTEKFTPQDFSTKLNTHFKKFFTNFELSTYVDNKFSLNLMKNQQVWTHNPDIIKWITPENQSVLKPSQVTYV